MKTVMTSAFVALAVLATNANATIVKMEFSGVFTSTYDQTGTGFGAGTGDNTGLGAVINGTMLWNVTNVRDRSNGNTNLYDTYLIDNVPITPPVPLVGTAPEWAITVNGSEYRGNQNLGVINTVLMADKELGAGEDMLHLNGVSEGHNAISPVANGHYDALATFFSFNFWLHDANGGTINGLNFAQPINWTAGVDGYATGMFDVSSQIFRDAVDYRHSGIAEDPLLRAGGRFSLTSLRSSEVPEPGVITLIAAGLAGMMLIRRRKLQTAAV